MTGARLPQAVSNQFDLVATSADRVRGLPHVHLQTSVGVRTYAVPAGDAWPIELRGAVARGQLYLDRSDKARLDDFARDLQRIEPLGPRVRCTSAPTTCLGRWKLSDQQGFDAESAALAEVLAVLRGLIVDVGAGWPRSLEPLRDAMAQGTVRYVAVDPEPPPPGWHDLLPHAERLQGFGEQLPLATASADAVLMLRSFNHLRDPAAALTEAARVLREDGRLVVADNVAFGLLRSPRQLARARSVPVSVTPFEHFRNACAEDALAVLDALPGAPFEVERVREVAPGTANQWLLVARRARSPARVVEALRASR